MEKVKVIQVKWVDVAEAAGLPVRTVYNWKKTNRRTQVTTDEKIRKALFALYGIGIDDIQQLLG